MMHDHEVLEKGEEKMRFLLVLLGALVTLAAAPTPAYAQEDYCKKGNTGKTIGRIAGGIGGALLGRTIDSEGDRTLGTIIGGAAGVFIGGAIGGAFDKCEQQKIAETTQQTLDSPPDQEVTKTWTSETRKDAGGTVVAQPMEVDDSGRQCRTVTRVNYIDGEEIQDSPTYCKDPATSQWVLA